MIISPAFADTAQTAAQIAPSGGGMQIIIQFALIFIVLYFLMIRPQQKKMRAHEAMLAGIKTGDEIIINGFMGKVISTDSDDKLHVRLADKVDVVILRAYVSQVIDKNNKG